MIRLFKVFIPASVVALLLSEIFLVAGCYFGTSLYALGVDPYAYLVLEGNYWKILFVTTCIVLGLYFRIFTENSELRRGWCWFNRSAWRWVALCWQWRSWVYPNSELLLPRWLVILGSLAVITVLPIWRIIYWRYVILVLHSERVLLLGNADILSEITMHILEHPQIGYSVVGYLCEEDPVEFPVPCLGPISDLRKVCESVKPTRIVVGMAERRNRLPVQELLEIRFEGTIIEDAADTYEMATRRVCSRKIQPSQLIFTSELGPQHSALALQNVYSFFLGLVGLIVVSPLMLLTMIAVRMTSKGPALFRQRRVGMSGHVFTLYKFRSMYVDAEARTGAVWAKIDDTAHHPVRPLAAQTAAG